LELEYKADDLMYSNSLATAIFNGQATCINQYGVNVTAQGSLGATAALLSSTPITTTNVAYWNACLNQAQTLIRTLGS
jgi:hypothetical protein